MAKESKLHEKPTRMSDVRESAKELAITTYVEQIQGIPGEGARSHRFTALLSALFGEQPGFIEEYVKGIEKYLKVKGKDRILRGRADQLSGNLIIEFESDLSQKDHATEAEEQLRRYTACIWSQEPPDKRTRFACLATDGRRFRAFAPVALRPDDATCEPNEVRLSLLEELDAARPGVAWSDFYLFLDRYLLRKEKLRPSSESIVKDFGPKSRIFLLAQDALLRSWEALKDHPDYAIRYDTWEKYLRIVYGSSLADHELFVRHTYLATLAKLMVWRRLTPANQTADAPTIQAILEGSLFKQSLSIENFLEEDFFSWVARSEAAPTGCAVARDLLSLLANYNLNELSEDVLKSLYEGLVDPATRHDLGEYYTPDWLAHRIVRKTLQPNPEASVLDPACGSGTFLYMTIREKRRLLGDSVATLQHIVGAVVGMDIHPLAVIVAKANYVLALGELMTRRKRKIAIPVYMANSIRLPEYEVQRELWQEVRCYRAEIADRVVHIPETLIDDPAKCDEAIEAAHDFARGNPGPQVQEAAFHSYLQAKHPGLADDEACARVLFSVAQTLDALIREQRDSIWVFVLKNIYRPLFVEEHFDLVLGNPPWLSYRYVERSDYQRFLKSQITREYGLVKGQAHLVTHLELGTLFLLRCADLYLKECGRIAFILPKSVFSADQHDALRRRTFSKPRPLAVTDLWDLEAVTPLFNTSSAVVFATKAVGPAPDAPIPAEILAGELPTRNASLAAAEPALAATMARFHLSVMGARSFWCSQPGRHTEESPYKGAFGQGATIVPRCFWFVDLQQTGLGFDEATPPLVSSQRAQDEAKAAYQGCVIQGRVESQFLYATLLSVDMLPFGYLRLRPVVLPVLIRNGAYVLYDADRARREGFLLLAAWLENVEREWRKRRSAKINLSAVQWLDYRHKLTHQKPTTKFRAIYGTSGTNVCGCVVGTGTVLQSVLDAIKPGGFVADTKTFHVELAEYSQAAYLAAFLNAPTVNTLIKPAQSRGLWGARDIHTKVLDLPMPLFDEGNAAHARLSALGASCAGRVAAWAESGGPGDVHSIGLLRRRVREMLRDELAEIDSIVKPMLGL